MAVADSIAFYSKLFCTKEKAGSGGGGLTGDNCI